LLSLAAPGSLASLMAKKPATPEVHPEHQVPQWLFAFDPAGMNAFRSMALLTTHPQHLARARQEIDRGQDASGWSSPIDLLQSCGSTTKSVQGSRAAPVSGR
jgi:hypothetical protein